MSAPWLTDPKYGGMSPEAARRSYEAGQKRDRTILPTKRPPASDEEIARRKHEIETLLVEYETAVASYAVWFREWKGRQRRIGFRATREVTP